MLSDHAAVLLAPRPVAPWTLLGQLADVRFTVDADPSPGLLPRLLAAFARRDLVPASMEARVAGAAPDAVMRVEIQLRAMPAEMVHLVIGNLWAAVGVRAVALRQEITGGVQRRAA